LEKAPLEGHLAAAGELTIQATKSTLRRRTRILLVNADRSQLHQLEATLLANGYGVVSASTFKAALELLDAIAPDMLVADVRLEAYNGLHLATRSRCHCPGRPVIVTHGSFDPVLDMYARSLDVPFIVKPLDNPEFLRHVRGVLDESRRTELMA
jgi:DNA-binding NtrC family response regulator